MQDIIPIRVQVINKNRINQDRLEYNYFGGLKLHVSGEELQSIAFNNQLLKPTTIDI